MRERRPLNRGGAATWVLALAPLLLVAFGVQSLWSVWWEPGLDPARARTWSTITHAVCPADVIVVMGAAQYDGDPSPVLARRLAGAAVLYDAGCAPLVVVSGGRRTGDRFSEGEAGVAWLRDRGLPQQAVRAESEATTSVENLQRTAEIAPSGAWVIVTDDLHAVRTRAIADRLGLDADVVGVRTVGDRTRYAFRETLALLAYRLGAFR